MGNFKLTKKPDLGIFNRQFPARLESDPIYDPTKMTILTGSDGILDDLFSYQVYNKIKNHWRAAGEPTDKQAGMIWSDSDDNKLYHYGAAWEEVLQLTRSSDVTPTFLGLLLAEYITHVGDADTYIQFQANQIKLRAGGVDFLNAVKAATDYLRLLDGLNFIGDIANTKMTQGLTIQQAGYDDEILALKSSDIVHGVTDFAETDTYAKFQKIVADTGGVSFYGFGEGVYAIQLLGIATADNTAKSTAALAPIMLDPYKKSGTGIGTMGANANLAVIRNGGSARWLADEDGDTWQLGEITATSLSSLCLGTPTILSIVGGVITRTRSYHIVDTQGDIPADNLDTINGGVAGMILVLQSEHDDRNVVVTEAGNIELEGGAVCGLNSTLHKIYLVYDAVISKWCEITRFTP